MALAALSAIGFASWLARTAGSDTGLPRTGRLPSPNAFDDYAEAARRLNGAGGVKRLTDAQAETDATAPAAHRPAVLDAERALVEANGPALAILRRSLQHRCRVPVQTSAMQPFPYLAGWRDLGRLLAAEADLRLERHDYAGAFSLAMDAAAIGSAMSHGGGIIHHRVAIAVASMPEAAAVRALDHLSATECRAMAARLRAALDAEESPRETIAAAEYQSLLLAREVDSDPAMLRLLVTPGGAPPPRLGIGQRIMLRIAWRRMRPTYVEETRAICASWARQAEQPAAKARPVPEPTTLLGAIGTPEPAGFLVAWRVHVARYRMLLCALGTREYQLGHGRLPSSLTDVSVSQAYVTDPFTGAPLVYRPRGRDYLLYSLGPDLKDGGGVPVDEQRGVDAPGDIGLRRFSSARLAAGTEVSTPVPHMRSQRR